MGKRAADNSGTGGGPGATGAGVAGGAGAAGERPTRVLGVHAQGADLKLVTVRAGRSGVEGPVVIEDARSVSAASLVGKGAREIPLRPGTEAVAGVLPASRSVVRVVDARLPEGLLAGDRASAGELANALALIAEMNLPASPAHRRAAGVLGNAPGTGSAVVVTGWQGEPDGALDALDRARSGGIEAWVPECAALWWLARIGCPSTAGAPSLSADRSTGGVCALAAGPEKLALRQLVEDGNDPAAWAEALESALAAASRQAGVQNSRLDAELASEPWPLVVGGRRTLERSIPGAGSERWLSEYGLALGAAAAALLSADAERGLLAMSVNPPRTGGRGLASVVAWLSHPARAACVAAATLGLVLATPWAVASARLARAERAEKAASGVNEGLSRAAAEADYLALLRDKRWPMTKMLAEVVGSAPREIQLDGVQIDTAAARSGTPIRVTGTTTSAEAVIGWRTAMSKGVVFESVQTPRTGEGQSTFELTARVAQPMMAMVSDAATLARFMRDAEANSSSTTLDALKSASASKGSTRPGGTGSASKAGGRPTPGAATDGGTPLPRPDATAPRPLPAPLSDAQIASLDINAVRREFAERAPAALRPNISPEDKARLQAEVAKLRDRLSSGGGK